MSTVKVQFNSILQMTYPIYLSKYGSVKRVMLSNLSLVRFNINFHTCVLNIIVLCKDEVSISANHILVKYDL